MNFLLIDQTLRIVLNAISGVPAQLSNSDGQPGFFPQVGTGAITDGHGHTIGTRTANNDQAKVTYDYVSVSGWGRDELRKLYDPTLRIPGDTYVGPGAPLGAIVYTKTGVREIVIQVKCECFDGTDGHGPVPIVESIRTKLGLPSIVDTLAAAGIAQQKIGPTHASHYDDENGRRVNFAIVEVFFNAADSAQDDPLTTIQSVDTSGITLPA